jgi:hypothetical protein
MDAILFEELEKKGRTGGSVNLTNYTSHIGFVLFSKKKIYPYLFTKKNRFSLDKIYSTITRKLPVLQ